ncbi:hypothetical protein [Pimelobacter simplex]|uniref:hypothetical protein n=1 Tax=Nocardioides simplex TaxID=2045 RepID=UPI003AADD122
MDGFERFLVVAGLVAAAWLALPSRRSLTRAGHRFAQDNDLWIAPELMAAVDRAHRRERWVLAVAALAVVAVLLLGPDGATSPFALFAVVVPIAAVGRLLLAGRDFPVRPGQVSVARPRAVRVGDYLPPTAPAAFAVWALLGAGAAGLGVRWGERGLAVAGAVMVLVTLAVAGSVVAVSRRPEPAVDAAHLYLQDAWRAARMRTTLQQLALAGFYLGLTPAFTDPALPPGLWLVPIAGAAAGSGLALHGRARFRDRLWPDVPAGQVLSVGGSA